MDDCPSDSRVVPFGNPRIKDYLHLPAAYRSLSRPSSPPRAKASAMRPFLLFLVLQKVLLPSEDAHTFSYTVDKFFSELSPELFELQFACVNMSKIFCKVLFPRDGGEYRVRTDDLLHAMQAL